MARTESSRRSWTNSFHMVTLMTGRLPPGCASLMPTLLVLSLVERSYGLCPTGAFCLICIGRRDHHQFAYQRRVNSGVGEGQAPEVFPAGTLRLYAGGNGRDKRLEGARSVSLLKVRHRDGSALRVMVVKPHLVVRVGLQISPARPPEFAPFELHPPFAGPECLAPRMDPTTPVVHR